MKQYEVYMCNLPSSEGSRIICGPHPIVVISNNRINQTSPVITGIPLTSKIKRLDLPTHILLKGVGTRNSVALCEQVMPVDRKDVMHYMGTVSNADDRCALIRGIGIQLGVAT